MTQDKKRKRETRAAAAADGRKYTASHRDLTAPKDPESAALRQAAIDCGQHVLAAFAALSYPAVIAPDSTNPTRYRALLGPLTLLIDAASTTPPTSSDREARDLWSFGQRMRAMIADAQPMKIAFSADYSDRQNYEATLGQERPFAHAVGTARTGVNDQLATEVDQKLATARRRDLAIFHVLNMSCEVCGTTYPLGDLVATNPAREEAPLVCPACVFDGDISHAANFHARSMVSAVQRQTRRQDAPAGWAGIAALLMALVPRRTLTAASKDAGYPPAAGLTMDTLWCWLPDRRSRPRWMRQFALAGASAAALLRAVATNFPDLRETVTARFREEMFDDEQSDDIFEVIDALWDATVILAISLGVQSLEDPSRRTPWHAIYSIEDLGTLAQHMRIFRTPSEWDGTLAAETVMLAPYIAEVLGLPYEDDDVPES